MYAGRSVVKGREAKLQRRREDLMRAWREARDAGDSAGARRRHHQHSPLQRQEPPLRDRAAAPQGIVDGPPPRAAADGAGHQPEPPPRQQLREYSRFAVIDDPLPYSQENDTMTINYEFNAFMNRVREGCPSTFSRGTPTSCVGGEAFNEVNALRKSESRIFEGDRRYHATREKPAPPSVRPRQIEGAPA